MGTETADWGVDPDSGAVVRRLTSAAAPSNNLYCEKPFGSPDGARLLVAREPAVHPRQHLLYVADLATGQLHLVETELPTYVANVPWGEWKYYNAPNGALHRVSLVTLERQQLRPPGAVPPPPAYLETITPDERVLVGGERLPSGPLRVFAFDQETGETRTIYQGTDKVSHEQIDPGGSGQLLYNHFATGPDGQRVRVCARRLATDAVTVLPFGNERSADPGGHITWVGTTGRVAATVNWCRAEKRHDPRNPQGNLLVAAPGDEAPRVFPAPDHGFWHVSVSRCGGYFVADDFMDFRADAFVSGCPGPVRIVVGNLATGKSRVLLRDCQSYGITGAARSEPCPYFTADNRHVIYNASPFGITQVFAAAIPPEFLAALG